MKKAAAAFVPFLRRSNTHTHTHTHILQIGEQQAHGPLSAARTQNSTKQPKNPSALLPSAKLRHHPFVCMYVCRPINARAASCCCCLCNSIERPPPVSYISSYSSGAPPGCFFFFFFSVVKTSPASFKLMVEEAKESAAAAERERESRCGGRTDAQRGSPSCGDAAQQTPSPFPPFTPVNNMKRRGDELGLQGRKRGCVLAAFVTNNK